MNKAQIYAEHLLDIKAVTLKTLPDFYIWASGWHAPIYCDNRKTLSFPLIRDFVAETGAQFIRDNYPNMDIMSGIATGGIAMGGLIADRLKKPFIYVRDGQKGHGLENVIEGVFAPGQNVGVFEDLLSTGGSTFKAVKAMKEAGLNVLFVMANFSYQFPSMEKKFAAEGIPLYPLCDYETLIQVAVNDGYIEECELPILAKWREAPENWGR